MKAKEAAEIIKGIEEVRGSLPEDGLLVEEALNMAIKALESFGISEQLLSTEPEQKKGKWNFIGDNMFECTYCGVAYTTQQLNGLRNYNVDPYAPKFCPNCGADMRGEQDERSDKQAGGD